MLYNKRKPQVRWVWVARARNARSTITPFCLLGSMIDAPTSVSMGCVVSVPALSITLYPDTLISASTSAIV